MLGLYIHIPFCSSLCKYCDFPKLIKQKDDVINDYINKLIEDINELNNKHYHFDTLYIGGGTPNMLNIHLLDKLLSAINELDININGEKTIECNFEHLSEDKIKLFKHYGINRLSIGVQTFDKEVGKYIGRVSDFNKLKEVVSLLNKYNLTNYNFDLIYGLPKQTLRIVESDLKQVLSLNPKHISYYSLILEENSVFGVKKQEPIEEEIELDMEELINKTLENNGFTHYEISNYAKPGFESKHNMIYWTLDEYIGLGLGAASYFQGKRYSNSKKLKEYMNNQNISYDEVIDGEYFIMGLRMLNGVSISKYIDLYKEDPFKKYNIHKLIDLGLLELNGDILKLTPKGLDLGNIVFEEFI